MSSFIEQELRARGVSQVIALMKEVPGSPAPRRSLSAPVGLVNAARLPGRLSGVAGHFIRSELSLTGQLLNGCAFDDGLAPHARRARVAPVPAARFYPYLNAVLGTVDREGLAALRRDRRVEEVVGALPLRLIRPWRVAAAKRPGSYEWGLRVLGVPALHRQGLTGKGVLVGHLDTGADGRHPALRGAIRHFAEFDDLGRERRPAPRPYDTDAHGTHTAATIAGRPVRGTVVGAAPGARLASAIVIEGGDVVARVLGGMDWAIGLGVRVVSMSLGFPGYWTDFLALTRLLRRRGVLPVFAVGNEGPGTSRSPGNYAEALSVGACARDRTVPRFSSSQRFRRGADAIVPDLVAPGVGIVSARPGGGWQAMDGTSMATPHVAGLAALLMEAAPGRAADEIERALFESCRLSPRMSPERAHRGLPSGPRALRLLV